MNKKYFPRSSSKSIFLVILFLMLRVILIAQPKLELVTSDLNNYWNAYDQLKEVHSIADSLHLFQKEYLDKASPYFRKFIKQRNFTAKEYIENIKRFPKFWKSIRPALENCKNQQQAIQKLYEGFHLQFKNFKYPAICLAVGCLRSGGTTSKNLLLIGAEIAAADSSIDKTELTPFLKSILGHNNILSYIAHESVHTLQTGFPIAEIGKLMHYKKLSLLNMTIVEGAADYITQTLFGLNINTGIQNFGVENQCILWNRFAKSIQEKPFDYSDWLYNGGTVRNVPPDMGYYMGYKFAEAFCINKKDSKKAMRILLKRGRYKKVFRVGRKIFSEKCDGTK